MTFKKTRPFRSAAVPVFVALLLTAPSLMAQESESLLKAWVLAGGKTMIFIGAAVVSFIALTVYNALALSKSKFSPDDLKMTLLDHMANCRVRSAIELAATHPSYLGRLVAYSFPHIDAGDAD